MQRIVRVVTAFILGRGSVEAEDAQPLRGCPARAVACLPKDMGGIAQVDLRAHGLAMHAKVGAMLLHPRQAALKQFSTAILQQAIDARPRHPGLAACEGVSGASSLEDWPPVSTACWVRSGLPLGGPP
jgi:hypothetical protein